MNKNWQNTVITKSHPFFRNTWMKRQDGSYVNVHQNGHAITIDAHTWQACIAGARNQGYTVATEILSNPSYTECVRFIEPDSSGNGRGK